MTSPTQAAPKFVEFSSFMSLPVQDGSHHKAVIALLRTACRHGNIPAAQSIYAHGNIGSSVLREEAQLLWGEREHPDMIRWILDESARENPDNLVRDTRGEWVALVTWYVSGLGSLPIPENDRWKTGCQCSDCRQHQGNRGTHVDV